MKIEEIKGKEIVDANGNRIGEVSDIELDLRNRKIEGIVCRGGGISSKVGMGKEQLVPCNMVDTIGDKVLLKKSNNSKDN